MKEIKKQYKAEKSNVFKVSMLIIGILLIGLGAYRIIDVQTNGKMITEDPDIIPILNDSEINTNTNKIINISTTITEQTNIGDVLTLIENDIIVEVPVEITNKSDVRDKFNGLRK